MVRALQPPDVPPKPGAARIPTLSVVVPVFNQAASIVQNLKTIRERVAEGLGEDFEIVVVSDGSIDTTEDELLAERGTGGFRVFHYDRNLGKGYAVKIGALEATGEWVGFIDADLDLDPADLPVYVRYAQEHGLDFAIGSKRHPASQVHYPPSRVVASWFFQQFVRLLFRLDLRDTQVGLKVFRREVVDQVLPLLMVKRYAFDIELLAVARAFGFDRIEEMPVRIDYQFTGSGVRSRAVLRALIDTAAIFYRLRILRYYQRQRALAGAYGWTRPREVRPFVSVLVPAGGKFRERDYPDVEVLEVGQSAVTSLRKAAAEARGDVLAILEPGGQAAGNWLSATIPFFARSEVVAVVPPKMAPLGGSLTQRAAAAVDESRIGAGLGYFRFTPGNVRFVHDYPASTFVVRRDAFLALPDIELEQVISALVDGGGQVIYSPESVIVVDPAPLFLPHLRVVLARGRLWGSRLRRGEVDVRPTGWTAAALLIAAGLIAAGLLDGAWVTVVAVVVVAYVGALFLAAAAATLRFQSTRVGCLATVGIVATHAVYLAGIARGLVQG